MFIPWSGGTHMLRRLHCKHTGYQKSRLRIPLAGAATLHNVFVRMYFGG